MNRFITNNGKNRQRGAALITSLMILLLVTIVGMASLQTTMFEEKMASSSRDRELAFQAAEAALSVAEATLVKEFMAHSYDLANWFTGIDTDCTDADYYCQSDASFDPLNPAHWSQIPQMDQSLQVRQGAALQSPRYVVEYVEEYIEDTGSGTSQNYVFNIYAKGYGSDERASVNLQSTIIISKLL